MNLVTGDFVTWDAPQFEGGSFFRGRSTGKPRCVGTKRFAGVIERDSYGRTGQHTFSIRLDDGSLKLVKGRNLYPHVIEHRPGIEHDASAQDKHERAIIAKEMGKSLCCRVA